jgi:hypothetical protein
MDHSIYLIELETIFLLSSFRYHLLAITQCFAPGTFYSVLLLYACSVGQLGMWTCMVCIKTFPRVRLRQVRVPHRIFTSPASWGPEDPYLRSYALC